MIAHSEKEIRQLGIRTSEAILLAFDSNTTLRKQEGINFYIPERGKILSCLGYSLREICDTKEEAKKENNSSFWMALTDLQELPARIVQGLSIVTTEDETTRLTLLGSEFLSNPNILDLVNISNSNYYRFRIGERNLAEARFRGYWNRPGEKSSWSNIQRFMRNYLGQNSKS